MAPVVVPGVNIPLLTGPLVLGYMFGYGLYGILIVQVYIYSELFPTERFGIRAVVWTLFFLETVFTFFTTISAYRQYGIGWGDIDTILFVDWTWDPLPALNGTVAGIAQSFYIWRVWSLSRRVWPPILIGCTMATGVMMAFYFGIVVAVQGGGIDKLFALSPEITVWLSASAICDLLITISLVQIFIDRKKNTNLARTVGTLNQLIRFSVETGSVTSAMAIIELILWLTSGKKWNIHFIFFLTLGKTYSNMLVATLNSRARVFSDSIGQTSMAPLTISMFWPDMGSTTAGSSHRTLNTSRYTHSEVVIDPDRDIVVMDEFYPRSNHEQRHDKPQYLEP
ncbi:hypothetical protein C8F04DRAFT_1082706 [Mycena alexandri]|uniref:DUF6534 domain-containing protein n=1 Tax=Mycena alexandri TaxID=1745969 RepID=A0AAD6T6X8_9AGAR|nr:hypothetical protein C8F04DRAFT_1082706 [Mycena alexandri]